MTSTCTVCGNPIQCIPAGTACGTLVLRHDLWTHLVPSDQFNPRRHHPALPKPARKARKAAPRKVTA